MSYLPEHGIRSWSREEAEKGAVRMEGVLAQIDASVELLAAENRKLHKAASKLGKKLAAWGIAVTLFAAVVGIFITEISS